MSLSVLIVMARMDLRLFRTSINPLTRNNSVDPLVLLLMSQSVPAAAHCRRQIHFSEGDAAYERYPSALEVPWNFYEGCQAFVPANTEPARVVLDALVFLYEVRLPRYNCTSCG